MSAIYIPANGPEDWRQFLAEPDRQWKDGYSAKELAKIRVDILALEESSLELEKTVLED